MTNERDQAALSATTRELETDIVTDFSLQLSFGEYLALADVLNAQYLRSTPVHHDEMRLIIQHQTSELWLKLMIHELLSARVALQRDDLGCENARGIREQAHSADDPRATGGDAASLRRGARPRLYAARNEIGS